MSLWIARERVSESPPVTSGPRSIPAPDQERLRTQIERFMSFERSSASEGERRAAQIICGQMRKLGARAQVEVARAHGEYWRPMLALSAAGTLGGLLSRRKRKTGAALALGAAAGVYDDLVGGPHALRRMLPRSKTYNVVAEFGPEDAERVLVFVSHHDAARSGSIFNPKIPQALSRYGPKALSQSQSSPPLMFPVLAGPLLAALGGLLGMRRTAAAGSVISAGAAAVFADIGRHQVVPGANDNISGVVTLLSLAERLAQDPTSKLKVMLVSTGSEESFMEGMRGFARQHFPGLSRDNTFVLCVDTVGSDRLCLLRAEGFLRLYRYPQAAVELVERLAQQLGIEVDANVTLRNATDGLYAAKAGYASTSLGSYSAHRAPANYHWPSDTAERVNYASVSDAVRLCEALVRELDRSWPASLRP